MTDSSVNGRPVQQPGLLARSDPAPSREPLSSAGLGGWHARSDELPQGSRPWDTMSFGLREDSPNVRILRSTLDRLWENGGPFIRGQLLTFFKCGGIIKGSVHAGAAYYVVGQNKIVIGTQVIAGEIDGFGGSQYELAGKDLAAILAHELGHWYSEYVARKRGQPIESIGEQNAESEIVAEINVYIYRNNGRWPSDREVKDIAQAVLRNKQRFEPGSQPPKDRLYGGFSERLQLAWTEINGGKNHGVDYDRVIEDAIRKLTSVPE